MNIQDILDMQPKDQNEQRQKLACIGCGKAKNLGLVVCWGCFKGGRLPFKDYTGSLSEWLKIK